MDLDFFMLFFFLLFFSSLPFFSCRAGGGISSRMVGFCCRSWRLGGSANRMTRAPCILGGDLKFSSPRFFFQRFSWEWCSLSTSRAVTGTSSIWNRKRRITRSRSLTCGGEKKQVWKKLCPLNVGHLCWKSDLWTQMPQDVRATMDSWRYSPSYKEAVLFGWTDLNSIWHGTQTLTNQQSVLLVSVSFAVSKSLLSIPEHPLFMNDNTPLHYERIMSL